MRILVIEDDRRLADGIRMALAAEASGIDVAGSIAEARQALSAHVYALVLLDVRLPDGSGLTLLEELRMHRPDLSVIIVSANDMEIDEVAGLEAGAVDYVTKPFSLAILRARVRAQLRANATGGQTAFSIGPFSFDFAQMRFFRDGIAVELTRTEQRLLSALVRHPGRTMARQVLHAATWPDGAAYVDENALSVTMRRLREKLERDPACPEYLYTVYGIGYRWGRPQ